MIRRSLLLVWCVIAVAFSYGQTIIVDNADPSFTPESGNWQTGTATAGKYGADYRFAENTASPTPTARARFTPTLPSTGYYYVSVWYNTGANRATNAPYTVHGDLVTSTVLVNQQINGAQFFYIGQAYFQAGNTGSVSLANNADNLVVMADAVQWVYAGPTPGPEPGDGPPNGDPENPELRGLWVSRFEWPRSTESATKSRLTEIITNMSNANFNALFLQVRGAMETFYPSPNEPWAKESFAYQPQPYDPMAYAITATHQAGMQFHAYINTHTINQVNVANIVPPPTGLTPPHPFYAHGNPSDPDHSDWVYHTSNLQPQALGAGEEGYNWTAPGVPTFQKWTRDQVLHVAQNYNVDGVHFDRIRFAGNGSFDPISIARSAPGADGNPDNLTFRNWNRDQVTRLLNDIYGAVAEINYTRPVDKRFIAVSTAPFRAPSQQASVNQMVGQWNALGAQDFSVPQIYTSNIDTFDFHIFENLQEAFGRHIVAGMSRNSTASFDNTRDFIVRSRQTAAKGTVIFSYTAFGQSGGELANFATTCYQTKVQPPAMDWVTTPTLATIVGNVTGPGGTPILDARIQRNGSSYTWLSGADGFYSMLKTPSSQPLTLTVTRSGLPVAVVPVTPLTPGEVRRINIVLAPTSVNDWMVY